MRFSIIGAFILIAWSGVSGVVSNADGANTDICQINPSLPRCLDLEGSFSGGHDGTIGVGGWESKHDPDSSNPDNIAPKDESSDSSRDSTSHDPAPSGHSNPGSGNSSDDSPHGWTEFVAGSSNCTLPNNAMCPLSPNWVCAERSADYEQRLADDPTIPEEDWAAGQLVHHASDGLVDGTTAACRNLAPSAGPEAPPEPVQQPEPPKITPGQVEHEFKSISLPEPDAQSDPSFPACAYTGWINYFYVPPPDESPVTVTILGTPVTIYPHVAEYSWDFGDGATTTTTDPGGPAPDGSVTHTYTDEGRFEVTVTVRWQAAWSAPGRPRSDVPGSTTTTSEPQVVWAHQRRIVLVSDPDAPLPATKHDPADACFAG